MATFQRTVAPSRSQKQLYPPLGAFSLHDGPAALALALLVVVSYFPALQGAFVWDDVIFAEEPVIHSPAGMRSIWFSPADIKNEGHYWPLVYSSFWLEHRLWGLQPAGPSWSSRIPGWRVRATDGASRVAFIPLFHTCRRPYPGGADRCSCRSLPDRCQSSPLLRRVGLRVTRFEACSAFTRVAARVVAEPPMAALCHRSASADIVTSIVRSDCYRLERQLPDGIHTR